MSDQATATGIGEDRSAVLKLLNIPEVTGDVPADAPADGQPAEPAPTPKPKVMRVLDTLTDEPADDFAEEPPADEPPADPTEPPANGFAELRELVAAQSAQINQLLSALTAKNAEPPAPPAPPAPLAITDEEYAAAFDSKEGMEKLLAKVRAEAIAEAQKEVPQLLQRRELEAQQLDTRVTSWTQRPENAKYISKDSPYNKAFAAYVKRVNDANAWDVQHVEAQLDAVAKAVEETAALFPSAQAQQPAAAGTGRAQPRPTSMGGSKRDPQPPKPDPESKVRQLLGLPPK